MFFELKSILIFQRYQIGSLTFIHLVALIEMGGSTLLISRRNITVRNNLPIMFEEDDGLEDVN